MKSRCVAIKSGDGQQCTRHEISSEHHLCKQHSRVKGVKTVHDQRAWAKMNIVAPRSENGKKVLARIDKALEKPVAKSDGPGYIYIYSFASEQHLHYYKVGRTKRSVKERLDEWRRDVVDDAIVLHATFFVERGHRRLESLVHLYLNYCRMYRTPYKHPRLKTVVYHSVWKSDGRVICDGQEHGSGKDKRALVAKNKQVEWFCAPLDLIERLCKSLAQR